MMHGTPPLDKGPLSGPPPPSSGKTGRIMSLIEALELQRVTGEQSFTAGYKNYRYAALVRFLCGLGRPLPAWLRADGDALPLPDMHACREGSLRGPEAAALEGRRDPYRPPLLVKFKPKDIYFPLGKEAPKKAAFRVPLSACIQAAREGSKLETSCQRSGSMSPEVCVCVVQLQLLEARFRLSLLEAFRASTTSRVDLTVKCKERLQQQEELLLQQRGQQHAEPDADPYGCAAAATTATTPAVEPPVLLHPDLLRRGMAGSIALKGVSNGDWVLEVSCEAEVVGGPPGPPREAARVVLRALPAVEERATCEVRGAGAFVRRAVTAAKKGCLLFSEALESSACRREEEPPSNREQGASSPLESPGEDFEAVQGGVIERLSSCTHEGPLPKGEVALRQLLLQLPLSSPPAPLQVYVPLCCGARRQPEASALKIVLTLTCHASSGGAPPSSRSAALLVRGTFCVRRPLFSGLVQLSASHPDSRDQAETGPSTSAFAGVARVTILCQGLVFLSSTDTPKKQGEAPPRTTSGLPRTSEAAQKPAPPAATGRPVALSERGHQQQEQQQKQQEVKFKLGAREAPEPWEDASEEGSRKLVSLSSAACTEETAVRLPERLQVAQGATMDREYGDSRELKRAGSEGEETQGLELCELPVGHTGDPQLQQQEPRPLQVAVYLNARQPEEQQQQQQQQDVSAVPPGSITLGILHPSGGGGHRKGELPRLEALLERLQQDPRSLCLGGLVWSREVGRWPFSVAELRRLLYVSKPLKSNGACSVHLVSSRCPFSNSGLVAATAAAAAAAGGVGESGVYILQSILRTELANPFTYMRVLLAFAHVPGEVASQGKSREQRGAEEQQKEEVSSEAGPLRPLDSPSVVRLLALYQDASCVHVLREWLAPPARKLASVLPPKGRCVFNEAAVRALVQQLLHALQLLQRRPYAHETYIQLTPEALYLRGDGRIALALPCVSRFSKKNTSAKGGPPAELLYKPSFQHPLVGLCHVRELFDAAAAEVCRQEEPQDCFPLSYLAPEELKASSPASPPPPAAAALAGADRGASAAADMWRVGVLTFHMLSGGPPFVASSREAMAGLLATRGLMSVSAEVQALGMRLPETQAICCSAVSPSRASAAGTSSPPCWRPSPNDEPQPTRPPNTPGFSHQNLGSNCSNACKSMHPCMFIVFCDPVGRSNRKGRAGARRQHQQRRCLAPVPPLSSPFGPHVGS
ncbi:hypothetical protein Esti_001357 [Eimeria stiedai]